jgi:hypothetical protein
MVLEDMEDPSCDGLMDLKKISATSVLETGKISPLTVPDGGVVLSRPRPTLGCSAHYEDEFSGRTEKPQPVPKILNWCPPNVSWTYYRFGNPFGNSNVRLIVMPFAKIIFGPFFGQ